MLKRTYLSFDFRVLIINLLSWLKKKNEPLAPDPVPALNTRFLFISRSNDSLIS